MLIRILLVAVTLLVSCDAVLSQTMNNHVHTEILTSNTYFTTGQANPRFRSTSFTDPVTNVTVNFDLEYTLDWDTPNGPIAGLAGFPEDANAGVGATTTGPSGGDSAKLEDLDFGGMEALERLTIVVSSVMASNGSAMLVGFQNPMLTVPANVMTSATATNLVATAVSGENGARLTSFEVVFKTTAIPEPSQLSLLGLVGLVLSGRSWYRRRTM